jgi:poly(A) polymerase
MDAEGLAASAELADGLDRLAKERIGAEMRKLLAAPDPAPAVAAMAQAGVLQRVLPGAEDRLLGVLVDLEGEAPPDPMRRLAILGGEDVFDALRLSRAEAQTLARMRERMAGTAGPGELGFRHGEELARDILLLRAALAGHPVEPGHWALLKSGANAEFPLKAADLMPGFSGPALGAELLRLEQVWIDSGFAMTRDELLR